MTTSNVKLLPLPDDGPYYDPGDMQEYARACVEANTEALRAEVEALSQSPDAAIKEVLDNERNDEAFEYAQFIANEIRKRLVR